MCQRMLERFFQAEDAVSRVVLALQGSLDAELYSFGRGWRRPLGPLPRCRWLSRTVPKRIWTRPRCSSTHASKPAKGTAQASLRKGAKKRSPPMTFDVFVVDTLITPLA
jgi:hypothetical protein